MLVLYPVMFMHVGVARGTLLMLGSSVLTTISARFTLEATRLQHGNLHLGRNEDFETLISASTNASNFEGEKSMMVALASKLYPVKLVLHSAVTIMVCSLVADEVASQFLAGDQGTGQFLFGILPALNSNHRPVPDSELIKMSRGFLICAILAFAIGLVAQVIACSQQSGHD